MTCSCMTDPEWVRDMDEMCVEYASMLLTRMNEDEVCCIARVEIVAKMLIAHTDILGGAASLGDIIARARTLMTQRAQGAH